MSKSDPTIGQAVETGDRLVAAGFKDSSSNYAAGNLDSDGNVKVASVPGTHTTTWSTNENHATAQTNNALVSAPSGSLSLYITDLIISNGATAGTIALVEDTGGTPATILGPYYLSANGGFCKKFATPKKVTAAKDLGFTSVTVTTHTITALGYTA